MKKYIIIVGIVLLGVIFILAVNPGLFTLQRSSGKIFSTSTRNLDSAKKSEIVNLNNEASYSLTASIVKKSLNGKEVKMLAYNGSVPGPTIKVKQGSEITVNFTNNTDVDSTVHPHGVRVANQFDGVEDVTQKAVKPGESFRYTFQFPDPGVFWYHPHIREDYTQELGLYGNIIVEPDEASYWSPVTREVALLLDDILLEKGTIAPFDKEDVNRTLMGRFGNTMLINGETNYNIIADSGDVVRLYLTNAANTRVFNFTIPGVRMKLVGSDNGKYEKETFVDSVVLSPSERSIVEVLFDKPGTYTLQNKTPQKTNALGKVTVSDQSAKESFMDTFMTLRRNNDTIASIDPLRAFFDAPASSKNLTLSLAMDLKQDNSTNGMSGMDHPGMQMGGEGATEATDDEKIEWEEGDSKSLNEISTLENVKWKLIDTDTKQENEKIDWKFQKGDKVKIKIFNDPKSEHPMQHPIHVHGQKFLVLTINGLPNDNLAFKDSVLVQKGDTVEILVDMQNPGKWLIHCHIPEHMEAGMEMTYQII